MRYIFFLLISLTINISLKAQSNTDWKSLELKGKVKSLITQQTYRYKKAGVFTEWEKTHTQTYLFTNKGLTSEYLEVGNYGYKIVYTYLPKEKKALLSYFSKEGKPTSTKNYLYDDKGRKTEEIEYTSEGKKDRRYVYVYDAKGNMIEMSGYKIDGSLSSRTTWTYDSNGYPSDYKVETPGYATSSKKFKYDDKGNRIEEIWYNYKGDIDFRFMWLYDSYGNKTQELKYKDANKLLDTNTWRYEYDSKGNWIKRTQSIADGNDFVIDERTIVYYY